MEAEKKERKQEMKEERNKESYLLRLLFEFA